MILVGAALAVLVLVVAFSRAARGKRGRIEVVFELGLPSKWAAELTAQTLQNDGVPSRIQSKGAAWKCYVTKAMGSDRSQIESTCRKLNQVAEARGGGCVAHRVKQGSRCTTFEH